MKNLIPKIILFCLALSLVVGFQLRALSATSIVFSYRGYTQNNDIPGTASAYTLVVAVQNRDSLISQKWTSDDIIVAVLESGQYAATYMGECGSCRFQTNSKGQLENVYFTLNSRDSKDNLNGMGVVPLISEVGYQDSRGHVNKFDVSNAPNLNPQNWQIERVRH